MPDELRSKLDPIVSRDVVFYEMSSWYKPVNMIDDVDAQNGNACIDFIAAITKY